MAYVNVSRGATLGMADRMAAIMKTARIAMDRRRVYTQTVRELGGLTDRELGDLGISRSQIAEVAHEAAYGK